LKSTILSAKAFQQGILYGRCGVNAGKEALLPCLSAILSEPLPVLGAVLSKPLPVLGVVN
jgi:hypothetical protein